MNKIKTYEILADEMKKQGRTIGGAEVGDEKLGPLKQLLEHGATKQRRRD